MRILTGGWPHRQRVELEWQLEHPFGTLAKGLYTTKTTSTTAENVSLLLTCLHNKGVVQCAVWTGRGDAGTLWLMLFSVQNPSKVRGSLIAAGRVKRLHAVKREITGWWLCFLCDPTECSLEACLMRSIEQSLEAVSHGAKRIPLDSFGA